MKPHVYPIDTPHATELWNKVCAAVQRQDLAGDILAMVQKSLDEQDAAIEHDEIVERLTKIFAAITQRCTECSYDLAAYCGAFADIMSGEREAADLERLTRCEADLGPFSWLRKYVSTDFAACADTLYEVDTGERTAAEEECRMLCLDFLSEATQNLLAMVAAGDVELAREWDRKVDTILDSLKSADGDFFGTEGQCDPRGDRRR